MTFPVLLARAHCNRGVKAAVACGYCMSQTRAWRLPGLPLTHSQSCFPLMLCHVTCTYTAGQICDI